jgi:predicted dehydrogenase
MKQAILKKGIVYPLEIPAPNVSKGSVIVQIVNSCISAGTEMSGVKSSGTNIIQRVLQKPENIKKVIDIVKVNGLKNTFTKVKSKLDGGITLGYSASGIIVDVGSEVEGFDIGDPVAVAGVGYANHAEFVEVPQNLTIKKPNNVSFEKASSVALGAIAMQGVRRANLRLGETCVVVGAGILGLLTIQMLISSGIRVCVLDLDEERLKIAESLGAELSLNPVVSQSVEQVINWSGGVGVDSVIFTAATHSSGPLSDSFKMCRRKGTVVLVGVSGMEINRVDIYKKELDFKVSTSYGPGRYDSNYEEKGVDYPIAYVRWTEKRNMQEYLRLIDSESIKLEKIIDAVYSIDKVTEAYESLKSEEKKPLMILLEYGSSYSRKNIVSKVSVIEKKTNIPTDGIINYALIGAGSFATSMHLPNLALLPNKFKLEAVCNRTGNKAINVAKTYGASYGTTDYNHILNDDKIDMVLIATRHDSHGELVIQALKAGKHVFVEKPLATNQEQLDKIKEFYSGGIEGKPILFVGFNRRFSKYLQEIKKHTDQRINPMFITYRMNAGYSLPESWVHDDGGRIVGECCHIIDLMSFLTSSIIKSISVNSLTPVNGHYLKSDNKSITLKYNDGSVCVINYFAVGNKALSKEYLEVHFDGKTIEMDNYVSLKGFGTKLMELKSDNSEKGQKEELDFLYDSIIRKTELWPISLVDLVQATEATFIAVADKE